MKKYLPLLLVIAGILVAGGVFLIRSRSSSSVQKTPSLEEETLPPLPRNEQPFASLTPSSDGHELTLLIERIGVSAESLEYEVLYTTADGRTQGVPGTIKLDGKTTIARTLLLGSESSGRRRYDEGVEKGTLTLRFRSETGKLVAKVSTEFHLQSNTPTLTSLDGKFKFMLSKPQKSAFFVTMGTFGLPSAMPGELISGPYGVFTSIKGGLSGKVEFSEGEGTVYRISGSSFSKVSDTSPLGVFILVSKKEE